MNKVAKKNKQLKPNTAPWRFYVVAAVILLVYLVLAARSAYIQVIEPDMLKKQGDRRSKRIAELDVQRGSIVDRNGDELAVSVPVETVWADPKIVMENNAFAMEKHWQALADVLGKDVKELTARIGKNPNKRFLYVERQVSPAMADYIKQLKIPGIHLRKESKRFYPAGEISAHIVGFTNVDDKGIEGIERLYDDKLTGTSGSKRFRKDAKGRKVEILSVEEATPPQNVELSIDQRIQALAYKELKGAVRAFKATSGSVVVVNVHSGEILALANSPSFNPNNRKNTAIHRFRNRAITDVYEPGSTMKPLSMLTALEFGTAEQSTVIDTSPGWMRLGGRRVSDPINRGKLSLQDILVTSSNMGTTKLALSVPKEFLLDRFFDAGFAEDTGTGLVGETMGMMSSRSRWSQYELATLSWGYGLAISPLQLARFYATLANGGVKIPLRILKSDEVPQGQRIFGEAQAKYIVSLLEGVVTEGGASRAAVDGYRVGGKTGTAIKAVPGGYGNDYVGLFAGVAPISNPELAVVVVINEPGGDLYHGGEIAAPVFSRVMKGALQVLNVEPDAHTRIVEAKQAKQIRGGGNA
ncbi:peptidoglycan glycosyltransferase FtsI [Thalassotalea sp. LPB0316]|uniref:peptidoglycan D,D-transpeptidase FtsI family protein n=1 Tax=Thalassotalea sp. LPB0316 TaxID=2769490 RepID=UPI001867FB66|nr:penicillin-binding transpeptidase domain-containing protein [Thalassotalea sp. LPB0316]QOL25908.1 peptidoglycan glycosyltransferase FtsI [Thalassotalea sp. LPB0316]